MKYFSIIMIVAVFLGCSNADVPEYNSPRYVQFEKIFSDTVTYSFVFYPGADQIKVPLELRLLGPLLESPAQVHLEVDKEHSTASAALYELVQPMTFRAAVPADTLFLLFKRNGMAEGDQELYTLTVNIEDGTELLQGATRYSQRVFRICNTVSKPSWWTQTVTNQLFGEYSDTKYVTFLTHIYSGDLSTASVEALRVFAIQFKNFLKQQNPPLMDGEREMSVPVIGS